VSDLGTAPAQDPADQGAGPATSGAYKGHQMGARARASVCVCACACVGGWGALCMHVKARACSVTLTVFPSDA